MRGERVSKAISSAVPLSVKIFCHRGRAGPHLKAQSVFVS
jgi:hypothetical protein